MIPLYIHPKTWTAPKILIYIIKHQVAINLSHHQPPDSILLSKTWNVYFVIGIFDYKQVLLFLVGYS